MNNNERSHLLSSGTNEDADKSCCSFVCAYLCVAIMQSVVLSGLSAAYAATGTSILSACDYDGYNNTKEAVEITAIGTGILIPALMFVLLPCFKNGGSCVGDQDPINAAISSAVLGIAGAALGYAIFSPLTGNAPVITMDKLVAATAAGGAVIGGGLALLCNSRK
jgi:hypothetical protein